MSISGPVLVVDSNAVMARIVAERLAQIGVTDVHTSITLRSTLTQLEMTTFALVISEYDTHPLTGFDLWRILTGREEWKSIPFILMADEERKRANIARFEEAGLPVVLAKPFSAEQLASSIDLVTSKNPFSAFV
ncbi:response regulator [Alsobacter sp. R-9]